VGSDAAVAVSPSFSAAGSSDQVWGMAERAWDESGLGGFEPGHLAASFPNGGAGFVGRHAV
jgi:hypothetical protein